MTTNLEVISDGYPLMNAIGRASVDNIKDLLLLKEQITQSEDGSQLKDSEDSYCPGAAEALCLLQEAFNF